MKDLQNVSREKRAGFDQVNTLAVTIVRSIELYETVITAANTTQTDAIEVWNLVKDVTSEWVRERNFIYDYGCASWKI